MRAVEEARPGAVVGPRRVLAVLCLTQITAWGVLFYAFPVLAPGIAANTGWSLTAVIGAFSVAQLVSAAAGVPVGRLLDRVGPRPVMTVGSLAAVGALAGMASAPSPPWFFAWWALVGASMSATLYQPAFAALTRWHGDRRVAALTVLTLVGGLASTVFAPLTAVLAEHLDWRQTYLVLAGVLAVLTVPSHLFGLRRPWPAPPVVAHRSDDPTVIARSRPFAVLVVAMSLGGVAVYAVVVAMVPLFAERGMPTTVAAWALGLAGVGQVLGRLGYGRLVARTSVRARTVAVLLAASATALLLGLVPGPAVALVAASVLAGAARGTFTLLHATAVTDRWGTRHYGRLGGLLHAPLAVTAAVSPWIATAVAERLGGYPVVFVLLAAAGAVAAVLALGSVPPDAQPGPRAR
ncbi:MFS transporter [Saccharothrix mutabilis subsp. mutabilis]|uniref:MFS transporter n=1 Tax=Saccharothrix mutabilis subsp. mutabilis TaxID=66855 RepID=A0ABN0UCX3_9PSEU